jgi:SMC interacting uncharacterized protein involved in chromosome segregation
MATKVVNNQVVEMTDEENNAFEAYRNNKRFSIIMKNLRAKRNKLLADTDYLALSDNTMTEEARTYRQALRDITEGLTTKEQVEAVVFPTKP